MSNPELPDFLEPNETAMLRLQFEAMERGRSVTPSDIRERLPQSDSEPKQSQKESVDGQET